MTKTDIKSPSNVDKANYDYLIKIPAPKKTLLDFIAIAVLEEKYPELKS